MSMFYNLMMSKKGDIPSRYQQVSYIQSTGTQYIDTGINPNAEIDFICDIEFTEVSAGRYGTISANNIRFYFGISGTSFAGANSGSYNHSIMPADTLRHIFRLNDDGLYIDDVLVYANNGAYPSTPRSILLFEMHANNPYASKSKCYSSIIKQNGSIIREYIPVYDTIDEKYGMWENIEKKFCGNEGTGDFLGA